MKSNEVIEDYKLLLKRIGENVTKARTEHGLTQRELAKQADKFHTVISKIEKYPPLDLSLRSIYEVVRSIPISLTEIIEKSESDLNLRELRKQPAKVDERVSKLMEKITELNESERNWIADMIEGLLDRTSSPSKLADRTDNRFRKAGNLN